MAGRAMAPPRKKANVPPEPTESAPLQDTTTEAMPLEEQIRARAYEIYLQREGTEGDAVDDWLRAESEIRSREPENQV